jgi:hypothetical protein
MAGATCARLYLPTDPRIEVKIVDRTNPPPAPPTCPFKMKQVEAFGGRVFTHKLFPNGALGNLITDEEKAFVLYAEHLEQENARLTALLAGGANAPANTSNTTPAEPTTANDPPTATDSSPTEEAVGDNRRQRAEEELLKSPGDSNGVIGQRVGASDEFVRKIRKEMIAAGRLESPTAARRGGQHDPPDVPVVEAGAAPNPVM